MWIEINTDKDIKCFLEHIDYFSDSCIKEMHYISGSYAPDRTSIYAADDQRDLCILFHSISNHADFSRCDLETGSLNTCRAFEIKFSGIHKLVLEPYLGDCDSVIYDVTLVKKDGLFYWYDYEETDVANFTPKGTLVAAEKMSWRYIQGSNGKETFYCSKS